MTTWQERSAEKIEQSARPVMESLAAGGTVDEGERTTDWEGLHPVMNRFAEDREGRVEYDRDAALWLYANPPASIPEPYRSAMIELAANPSPQVRRAMADAMAEKINIPGIVETRPAPSRELSTAEFLARHHSDVAELMRYEGLERSKAKTEFFWRYAEEQTGTKRCPEKSKNQAQGKLVKAKTAAYMRAYNNE